MKLIRPALAMTLVASLAVAGAAEAKVKPKPPKPVCNLITDPKGDAALGVSNDDALDLLSVDFGADAKKFTVVARVAKASLKSSVLPAGSIKVTTYFTLGETKYFVTVLSDGTAVSGNFGTQGTGSNTILTFPEGKIDPATNELRITVPAIDFPGPYKTGLEVSAITTFASAAVVKIATPVVNGSTGGRAVDDAANPDKSYKIGNKTCVTIGK